MATDPHEHILLKCRACGLNSWAERQDIPAANIAGTHTGTWLRCAHCNAPLIEASPVICPECRGERRKAIDSEMLGHEDDDEDDDLSAECGRWNNGRLTRQCRLAGTEWCDWDCPIGY